MNRLVFDIGFHKGEDAAFYLKKGYKVIAVDADPELADLLQVEFNDAVKQGKLVVQNFAITDKDQDQIVFSFSQKKEWSSASKEIADREGMLGYQKSIQTKTLRFLIAEFGNPYYCKIDIEGNDFLALKSLSSIAERPQYISVESECAGEGKLDDSKILQNLNLLKELGYTKFKLVDQSTLEIVPMSELTILSRLKSVVSKCLNYILNPIGLQVKKMPFREILSKKHGHRFRMGSSGPFGPMLDGIWLDYQRALEELLKSREAHFKNNKINYSFWLDIHATN